MANLDKFEPDQIIEALRNTGGIRSLAAQMLHCSPSTVTRYIETYPEVAEALAEVKDSVLDIAEAKLITLVREGSERSVHFYLRTQGKHRGFTERVEQTGANGGPIQTQPRAPVGLDLSRFTTEELETFEALCAKAAMTEGDEHAAPGA